jgi:5-methylcytosine-specific restriction protein A
MTIRNPKWSRDELILALDLYFKIDFVHNRGGGDKSIDVLSDLLNSLPIHTDFKNTNFRNRASVYMKLSNFLRLDPQYTGKGLERGSKGDEDVWNEFASNLPRLRQTAHLIKQAETLLPANEYVNDSNESEEFAEGKILTKIHKFRERNSSLVKRKKEDVLRKTGKLECEICTFDFRKAYGKLGEGYAECHHIIPISAADFVAKTKLSDLAIVCSNCHRMIHRSPKWLTIDEIKSIYFDNQKKS